MHASRSFPRLALLLPATLVAAGLHACAPVALRPSTADADAAQALRTAQEARLELQALRSRIAELEMQVRDLSDMLAWNAQHVAEQSRRTDGLRPGVPSSAPRPATGNARVTHDEATEYRQALDLYFARRYAEAIEAFRGLLARHPRGTYADNAEYWIGESHYGLGDYRSALDAFGRVAAMTSSTKADDAQLKLGYCHLRLGDRRRAGEEFRKLVSLHPSSEYVARAKAELEKLDLP